MTEVLVNGRADAPDTLILAHGAGAGMRSAFMERIAQDVSRADDIRVIRFDFDYMAAGRKRPDPTPKLLAQWRSVIDEFGTDVFIGGKSMGGRMASMIADECGVEGLVCVGYPFHPPAQPDKLRTAHLETLATPTLIVQGTRDQFGTRGDVAAYALSPAIHIEWIQRADHSLRNRADIAKAVASIVTFITERAARGA